LEPFQCAIEGSKAGYIDQTGRIVIPPSFPFYGNHGGEFHGGLPKNDLLSIGKEFFLDMRGKTAFPTDRFGEIGDFSEGLAPARPHGEREWGFVNSAGRFVIPPKIRATKVGSFSEGLAPIKVDGKTGYINRSGRIVVTPSFVDAAPFGGGFARVIMDGPCLYDDHRPCSGIDLLPDDVSWDPVRYFSDPQKASVRPTFCQFSFINKSGKVITKLKFDDAGSFSEGFAAVKVGMLWGYINQTGKVAIPPQFISTGAFSEGRASVEVKKSLWGYIDIGGKTVIQPSFMDTDSLSEGLAAVSVDGRNYIYIDRTGKQAISVRFAAASHFYRGLAHVKLSKAGGRFAYINRFGRRIFAYDAW
jgi:hypothetical protein